MISQTETLKQQEVVDLPPGLSCSPSVCKSIEIGIPTFLDLPATTTFFPNVCIPYGACGGCRGEVGEKEKEKKPPLSKNCISLF